MRLADILTVAASQGGGAAASPYGPELATNGDFAGGETGWTDVDGIFSVSGGVLTCIDGGETGGQLSQTISGGHVAAQGNQYRVVYTVTARSGGSVAISVGDQSTTSRSAAGTYEETITIASPTPTNTIRIVSAGASVNWSLDNLSVKLVL